MVNFKEEIAKLIAEQVSGLDLFEIQEMIEVPQDSKMGDYAFPCFKLAKTLRKAPPLIAPPGTKSSPSSVTIRIP